MYAAFPPMDVRRRSRMQTRRVIPPHWCGCCLLELAAAERMEGGQGVAARALEYVRLGKRSEVWMSSALAVLRSSSTKVHCDKQASYLKLRDQRNGTANASCEEVPVSVGLGEICSGCQCAMHDGEISECRTCCRRHAVSQLPQRSAPTWTLRGGTFCRQRQKRSSHRKKRVDNGFGGGDLRSSTDSRLSRHICVCRRKRSQACSRLPLRASARCGALGFTGTHSST